MNIIEKLKSIKEQMVKAIKLIDLSAINLTEGQKYVLDLNTSEAVTVFNCFNRRQEGQSTGALLKAIQLSNENNVDILVSCKYQSGLRYKQELFEYLLRACHSENKAKLERGSSKHLVYIMANGSTITFRSLYGTTDLDGLRYDYAINDDTNLNDQEYLNAIVATVLSSKKGGQAFFFPTIRGI